MNELDRKPVPATRAHLKETCTRSIIQRDYRVTCEALQGSRTRLSKQRTTRCSACQVVSAIAIEKSMLEFHVALSKVFL
jgi:hypothetical protein